MMMVQDTYSCACEWHYLKRVHSAYMYMYLVGSIQPILNCESVCFVLFRVTAICGSQSQDLIHPP